MKKIALSLVMSCALLASTAVMAQDAKPAKAEKAKTETRSCCSKGTDKKAACTSKGETKSDAKKSAPAKAEKK